jgi:hypothetical protein
MISFVDYLLRAVLNKIKLHVTLEKCTKSLKNTELFLSHVDDAKELMNRFINVSLHTVY